MSIATPQPLETADAPGESDAHRRLRALLEQGLPLTPRPWQALAEQAGLAEEEVMACVRRWQADGMIKRLGLVVRHRRLGIQANAMVVWDVPDERVALVGRRLARETAVTLCYRRPRRLPDWPYNLFCMIHGTRRERVLTELEGIVERLGLDALEHRVLFSTHAYRQRGGRYVREGAA
ncbi:DNA-binding Lrp family transcriptional regulator [Halomonas fontilapidosi]|uniref:siroheme decarboxylase n=1 Tax=Halomonas fontilapidosi TaxID=616675 RepID=A0A7W5DJC8_9GAMM|nr:AsnC family protein [Halomonas fontilapidosi]MBB3184015.1 DNA-binding Lrp family transcriptional regulator [Halomonas fontilapidosi]